MLVHEAYLRLAGERAVSPTSRAHFFAIAARVMRYVLIAAARSRNAQKRARGSGDFQRQDDPAKQEVIDSVEFTDALHRLAAHDERQAAIVKLRFVAGLTEQETVATLGISVAPLKREWVLARAWLFRAPNQEAT